MDAAAPEALHAAVHEPLLGTRVLIRLRATNHALAERVEQAVVAEIERLEALLSAYRPDSEWSRWRHGQVATPGPEILELLALAARWHHASDGAFNPLAGVLRARWLRAVDEQVGPSVAEMADLASTIASLPYVVSDAGVERTGDYSLLDLHAIAKGWIVDRAAQIAVDTPGIVEVLLNAGGDLLHRGLMHITAGIEDPRRPFDNVPPLTRVTLRDEGLASSSGARRPMRIGGVRHSHVLDPRTGWPVQQVIGATVIAPDAATADVVATIVGVLPIADGLRFADARPGVACHLLDTYGAQHTSAHWPTDERPHVRAM